MKKRRERSEKTQLERPREVTNKKKLIQVCTYSLSTDLLSEAQHVANFVILSVARKSYSFEHLLTKALGQLPGAGP